MMRHKIAYASLVTSVIFAAMTATAQTASPVQDANVQAAPSGRSFAAPAAVNSGASPIEATNVFEGIPRDTSGKAPRTCGYDPLDEQMGAACRRRLEIAGTQSVTRAGIV